MVNSINKTSSQKKKDLIKLLIDNSKIVEIIDNQDSNYDTPDYLINRNIFPFAKIDFTPKDAGTYIGIKINYPRISKNITIKECVISFVIISHNNHNTVLTGEARTDLIAEEIINMFNHNHDLGFTVNLLSDIEDPLNETHYYRKLDFKTEITNSLDNLYNNGV